MDPNKLTAKASEAISAAAELATEAGNPQLTPVHLAVALFEDPNGLGKQV
jgi:ATP-dependent Clp protease ATP-binding subunit ClpB